MIKNKEEIKNEVMKELELRVAKYIDEMDKSSNEEKFPIEKIEKMLGEVIKDSKRIIVDKTTELLANIDEEKEIVKKKPNMQKRV